MRLTTYLSAAFAFLPVVITLQECYVCLSRPEAGSPELEHQFPEEKVPVCQRGVLPPPKQCPPRYKGCLTQYSGELVQRSCGELSLNICQAANGIDYCYCEGNLCNSEERALPKTTTSEPDTTSDDEDDGGGSGQGSDFGENRPKSDSSSRTLKPNFPLSPIDNNLAGSWSVRASPPCGQTFLAILTAASALLGGYAAF